MYFNVFCRNIDRNQLQAGKSNLDVYFGITDNLANKLPFFFNLLSDSEKERASRFKHVSDYNCYVSVHALLRIELSKRLRTNAGSIIIMKSKNGKPFTSGVDLPFSLSRSKNLFTFVIGQSNQSLGIDVEQIKPSIDFVEISRNYFSEEEQKSILLFDGIDDQNRTFYEIWTRKEAFLKAIGIGIATKLSNVNVLVGENQIDIKCVSTTTGSFKILTTLNHNALISIASSADFTPGFNDLSL